MMIASESILALLRQKAQNHAHDGSRHLLCPHCRKRTVLYTLSDGRKKCSICVRKFSPAKKTDVTKLKQYADTLLCFCFDFSAQQASKVSKYHYRLISGAYEQFRILLATQSLDPKKMLILNTVEKFDRGFHDNIFLRRTKDKTKPSIIMGDAPVFGVKFVRGGKVFIEPLKDEKERFSFDKVSLDEGPSGVGRFSDYAGFIRNRRFQRFTDNNKLWDSAENVWAWISQRLRNHHGISNRYMGLYLKELEWKYNNRLLNPKTQALKIASLMPDNFLTLWAKKGK